MLTAEQIASLPAEFRPLAEAVGKMSSGEWMVEDRRRAALPNIRIVTDERCEVAQVSDVHMRDYLSPYDWTHQQADAVDATGLANAAGIVALRNNSDALLAALAEANEEHDKSMFLLDDRWEEIQSLRARVAELEWSLAESEKKGRESGLEEAARHFDDIGLPETARLMRALGGSCGDIAKELLALRQQPRPVPVRERLPEVYKEVMWWYVGPYACGWIFGGLDEDGKVSSGDFETDDISQFTHWMSIPPNPNTETP